LTIRSNATIKPKPYSHVKRESVRINSSKYFTPFTNDNATLGNIPLGMALSVEKYNLDHGIP
jgi:hypothetical protein